MERIEILDALAKKKREYARLKKMLERSVRAAHVKDYVQKKVDELSVRPPIQGQLEWDDKDHLQQSSVHQNLETIILSHPEQQGSSLQCSLHDQSSSNTSRGSDTKSGSPDHTEKCKSLSFNSESRISTRNLVVPNDNLGNKAKDQCKEQTQAYKAFSGTVSQKFPNGDDKNTKHDCDISMCTDVNNAHSANGSCKFSKRKDPQRTEKHNPALEISVPASSQCIDSFHCTQEGIKLAQAINPVLTSIGSCQDNLKSIDNNTVHVSSRQGVSAFAKSPKSPILRENKYCSSEMKENVQLNSTSLHSKDFLHSDYVRKCSNLADGNRIDIEDAKSMLLNASQKSGLDKCGISKISCNQLSLCEYGIMDTDFSQSSVFLESQVAESDDLLMEPLQTRRKGRKRKSSGLQGRRTSQRLALRESSQGSSSQTSDHSWVTSWSQVSPSSSGTNYQIVLPTCSQGLSQGVVSFIQQNHPKPSFFPKLPFQKIKNRSDVSFSLPEKEFGSLMRDKINDACKYGLPDTESVENSEIDCHPIPITALSSDRKLQIQLVQENKKDHMNMAQTFPWLLNRKMSSNSDMSPGLFSTPDDSVQQLSSVSPDVYVARAPPAGIATIPKETDASCDHLLEPPVSEMGKSKLKYLGSLKLELKDIQHLLYGRKGTKNQSDILCCVTRSQTQLWSACQTHLWKQSAEWKLSQSLSIERAHLLSYSDFVVLLLVCVDEESVSIKLLTYDHTLGSSNSINIALDITMHDRVSSCCLSENQFVVGVSCSNCTRVNKYSLKETGHELENKSELQSVDRDLHSLSTVRGQNSAVLGTSSKCVLIWNHDVGHLLMSIPTPDALLSFTSLSPVFMEKGYIFLPLLYTSVASPAGCMLACNPTKKRTKVLFQYDTPPNVKPWSGVQDVTISDEMMFAIDLHHTLYIWDVFSGQLQYRQDNTRTVAISNGHIVTASTTGCIHIHER